MTVADLPPTPLLEDAKAFVTMGKGPTVELVHDLSRSRNEPDWMLRHRLRALERLRSDGVPAWAAFLRDVDFEGIVSADGPPFPPETAKDESSILPGLGALAESEAAYRSLREDLKSRGVRFSGLASALASTPNLVKPNFAAAIPMDDHPIAALNGSLWTGGSFLYVPPGVRVEIPLQAEIRADYENVEPFERNLIVADRGSEVTYIEGCTAPVYTPEQLHVSAIEVVAMPHSRVRYIALQNFSRAVDNLVTKRALVHEGASIEWVDANLGSRRTWKVPRADLLGPGAAAEFVGIALAGKGQHEDVGSEVVHRAPRTSSKIVNRGIVHDGGRATLRSGVQVDPGATGVTSSVEWSALMLDADSRAETAPSIVLDEADAEIVQEGSVRKVSDDMLFYMASRGVTRDEALRMVVLGTAEVVTARIPVEYAVEVDRLIELELGGGVG